MRDRILDIFYNNIVQEASSGRVNCYFYYNVIFRTRVIEDDVFVDVNVDNQNLFIPTLMIKNKCEFDRLLLDYVDKAMKFYDDSNFEDEVRVSALSAHECGICREKVIMTLLWSNATVDDFNNPILFLKKRISFLEDDILEKYLDRQILGYSEILGGNIEVCSVKNKIGNETPYSFRIFLKDNDGNYMYEFPRGYVGISDDCAYVYAIQNSRDKIINDSYRKKIDRKLYKVNEGFDVKKNTYCEYGIGNLKDITPSFLVAANIIVGILNNNGIDRVSVPSILVERWNAKCIVLEYRKNRLLKKNSDVDSILNELRERSYEYLRIQSNLTEKFLRVFRRLDYHHSGISILNYPYDIGESMDMYLDDNDNCSNKLLSETYFILANNCHKKR